MVSVCKQDDDVPGANDVLSPRSMLSANDLHALSAAHRARKPLTLTRTLGDVTVTVRTLPASEAWGANYLVRIRVERGHRTDIQTFESVEALRMAWG